MNNPTQTYAPPLNYTPRNVIYWESTSNELRLAGRFGIALLNKARKFLLKNCIEQINDTNWICKPIKDYNKTSHDIILTDIGFTCDCQGFRKKQKDFDEGKSTETPICLHIVAIKQFCFLKGKNNEPT